MQELYDFAVSLNFKITSFDLDGKIHRFDRDGKKNAWYVGYQLFNSHGAYNICILGDWKTGEKHEFKPTSKKLSKDDRDAIKIKMAQAAERAEKERAMQQDDACLVAEKIIKQAKPVAKGCDYLERKKIDLCGALTVMDPVDGRVIVVPMRDIDGKLWGVQRIFPNGDKFFLTCQRVEGAFFVIGDLDDGFVYICEGFATGASIRQATEKTVIVTFNASNLVNVARAVRRKYPNKIITICGDDDRHNEENVGRSKADEAARVAMGVAVFPRFKGYTDGTDFNDLHCEEGVDKVVNQLNNSQKPDPIGYVALGYDEGTHFFYDLQTRGIKKTTNFSENAMFELMPVEYWQLVYPSKRGVNWSQACSDIIQASKKAGPFDSLRIRGTGVWLDSGRTVINTGRSILHNGCEMDIGSFKSRYVYVQTKNKMPPIHTKPLTTDETALFRSICEEFKWRDPRSAYLLAGWIAVARVAGSFPVRPHIWLTGSAYTGKSTVMKFIDNALGSPAGRLFLQGGTTEAGIRQSVKADSLPIIFDEFETNSDVNNQRNQSIIELLRQTWSHTQGHIVKGSAGGAACHYELSFAALVTSIRVVLDNEADKSRFSVLELVPHGNDELHWKRLEKMLAQVDEEYGERLFARSAKMMPVIIDNYKAFSTMISRKVNKRFGQQYGMLLAGWYSLLSDTAVTDDVAEATVGELDFSDYKIETQGAADEIELLIHMMTTRVTVEDAGGNRREATVGSIIADDKNIPMLTSLKNYGILVESDSISFANQHAALKKHIFGSTKWAVNWSKSLLRIKGATASRKRIDNRNPVQSVTIPMAAVGDAMTHGTNVTQLLTPAKP